MGQQNQSQAPEKNQSQNQQMKYQPDVRAADKKQDSKSASPSKEQKKTASY